MQTYDSRWAKYLEASLALVLDRLSLEGNERVLDLACGTGELERRLLAKWPRLKITGIDISDEMLSHARRKIPDSVEWIRGDARSLPFANESFDVIVCANAFHYFDAPRETLTHARRLLRSDGKLVLVDWCNDFAFYKLLSVWLRVTRSPFFKIYSLVEMENLLTEAGFHVNQKYRTRITWPWALMTLSSSLP